MFFNSQHIENVPAATENLSKKPGDRQTNCPFSTIMPLSHIVFSLIQTINISLGAKVLSHTFLCTLFRRWLLNFLSNEFSRIVIIIIISPDCRNWRSEKKSRRSKFKWCTSYCNSIYSSNFLAIVRPLVCLFFIISKWFFSFSTTLHFCEVVSVTCWQHDHNSYLFCETLLMLNHNLSQSSCYPPTWIFHCIYDTTESQLS